MDIHICEKNRNLIVEISGEIDHHCVTNARDQIDRAYSRLNARNIIFDFENVNFMDSSGIGMIIGRYRNIKDKGAKVAASNINSDLMRIFEISGLKKIIPCYKNIDEAVKSL